MPRWTSSAGAGFIILHCHLDQRTDSPVRRRCREMEVPPSLTGRMGLYRSHGCTFRQASERFTHGG
ncbi:MAG: tryptophan 7-halogenase [Rubrivivax sp.]